MRKKNNNTQRLIRQTMFAVKDVALTMVLQDEPEVIVKSWKTGKEIPVSQSLAMAIGQTAFKWYVLLVVFCKESNGKLKTVTLPMQVQAAYKHDALTDYLREQHQAMVDEAKSKTEVLTAGWIACPIAPSCTDEELLSLIEKDAFCDII